MSRLDEIQARLDAATPGPWGHWPEAGTIEIIGTDEPGSSEPRSPFVLIASEVRPAKGWGEEIYEGPEPDADLIAHAPTDLATLVKFARAMEGLHRPHKVICLNPSHSSDCDAMVCDTCDTPWPCPTAKALDQIGGAS